MVATSASTGSIGSRTSTLILLGELVEAHAEHEALGEPGVERGGVLEARERRRLLQLVLRLSGGDGLAGGVEQAVR